MSNAVLAAIIVPIVVAIALAVWITMVYHAERHPDPARKGRGSARQRQVAGGSFRGRGGRQLMPLPNTEPDPELDRGGAAEDPESETHRSQARSES